MTGTPNAHGIPSGLFRIDSSKVSFVLFLRVAVAVGLPMFGFLAAGHPGAAIIGGAIALFVSMSDVGITRRGRMLTMATSTVTMFLGGILGHRFGALAGPGEALIIAAAFLAGWVSNSQPGLAAIARFTALATIAGAGMQVTDDLGWLAVIAGGASAIGAALIAWQWKGVSPDENFMDWRTGVRRAFAGAGTGPWFAICFAAACAVALFVAQSLGVQSPYWACYAVIATMRREGMVSRKLMLQYIIGTVVGIPIAAFLGQVAGTPLTMALIATLAAASGRLGFMLNPALGYLSFIIFLVMLVEIARHGTPPVDVVIARAFDVAVGCAIAFVATQVASLSLWKGNRHRDAQTP